VGDVFGDVVDEVDGVAGLLAAGFATRLFRRTKPDIIGGGGDLSDGGGVGKYTEGGCGEGGEGNAEFEGWKKSEKFGDKWEFGGF
jgi:hypothetical protein